MEESQTLSRCTVTVIGMLEVLGRTGILSFNNILSQPLLHCKLLVVLKLQLETKDVTTIFWIAISILSSSFYFLFMLFSQVFFFQFLLFHSFLFFWTTPCSSHFQSIQDPMAVHLHRTPRISGSSSEICGALSDVFDDGKPKEECGIFGYDYR